MKNNTFSHYLVLIALSLFCMSTLLTAEVSSTLKLALGKNGSQISYKHNYSGESYHFIR